MLRFQFARTLTRSYTLHAHFSVLHSETNCSQTTAISEAELEN